MDSGVLGMAALAAVLAVPAFTDIRTRTVYNDALATCWAVAACFFAYDAVAGGGSMLRYGLAAAGIMTGAALARAGAVGSADGHVVAVASVMAPEYGGVPVALLGTTSGFVGCLAAAVLHNAACNMRDAVGGKEYCGGVGFVTMHYKRAGERFTTGVTGPARLSVRGETVRTEDGAEYFAPDNEKGTPVGVTMPAVAFIAAGAAAVSFFAAF